MMAYHNLMFHSPKYLPDLGTLTLYDEKQEKEYWHGTDDVYNYIVPNCGGDSYYNLHLHL